MRFLALLHSPVASGNDTTIRRIATHLSDAGHPVLLLLEPAHEEDLAAAARQHRVDALIGTHALLSGRAFAKVGLPYFLILAGTDVNEFALDREYLDQMTHAVEGAAGLVAFNEDFVQRGRALWPQATERLYHIPQSTYTAPSDFSLRAHLGLEPEARIFLLPSGLRPVKDPLFLVDCFRRWHAEDPRIHLVISGLSYEEGYEAIVLRRIGSGQGMHFTGPLERCDLHAAMLDSVAVLNTSVSECSPNAVLEAMDLGRPVLVRDIPGNTCLIRHGNTGLTFRDPDGFRVMAERLLDDEPYGELLGLRAREAVRRFHNPAAERSAYVGMVRDLLDTLPAAAGRQSGEQVVRRGSVDLCVQTFGDPQDPAVLLIAGSGASMLAWDAALCERVAAGGRFVVRFDHRDTGRSTAYPSGEPPYTLRDLADDAIGVLDGLGLAEAHLVGASLGGMIAQLVALEHPERTTSLTLVSTSPGGAAPDGADHTQLPPTPLSVLLAFDALLAPDWTDRDSAIEYLTASARVLAGRSRPFDEGEAQRLAGRVYDRSGAALPSAANHLYLDYGEPWRWRLGALRAPTLVIHGSEDPIYPLAHAYALAAEIPHAALRVLEQAGHELSHADRDQVTEALLQHTATATADEGRIRATAKV